MEMFFFWCLQVGTQWKETDLLDIQMSCGLHYTDYPISCV